MLVDGWLWFQRSGEPNESRLNREVESARDGDQGLTEGQGLCAVVTGRWDGCSNTDPLSWRRVRTVRVLVA